MRFPRMHIAESTINRILNVAAGVEAARARATLPPALPDTAAQGAALDNAMSAPPPPVDLPPGGEDALVQASLEGGDLVTAVTEAAAEGEGLE